VPIGTGPDDKRSLFKSRFYDFYALIFEVNRRRLEGPHVLRAIKVIFHMNVGLALNENVIQ